MSGPFKAGFVTQPQADELNRLLAKVRALDGITTVPPLTIHRGPDGRPIIMGGVTAGEDGTDASILVVLTARSYAETFIEYSAVEVEASGDLTYAVRSGGEEFSPGGTPLYHERNLDLPPVHTTDGVPDFIHPLSVFRARQNPDGFWYFSGHPWVDLFRRTGDEGDVGETAYHRFNDADEGVNWVDGIEVELIEAE